MTLTTLVGICFILWMLASAPFWSVKARNAHFILMLVAIAVYLVLALFPLHFIR